MSAETINVSPKPAAELIDKGRELVGDIIKGSPLHRELLDAAVSYRKWRRDHNFPGNTKSDLQAVTNYHYLKSAQAVSEKRHLRVVSDPNDLTDTNYIIVPSLASVS